MKHKHRARDAESSGREPASDETPPEMSKKHFRKRLRALQIELVKLQRDLIARGQKVLVLLEGRDGAGKDGTIKRIVAHMSPRETRVVALGKPSDRNRSEWYFQRWTPHLPAAAEFVLLNRSWYNRAGVERVMGFCSDAEYEEFMATVTAFETMLVRSDLRLLKYYLDISREEQIARLRAREEDPLKQWKLSPIDQVAVENWAPYTLARDAMLTRTHTGATPWTIVQADDKQTARLALIADLLWRMDYAGKDVTQIHPNPQVAFDFDPRLLSRLSPAQG